MRFPSPLLMKLVYLRPKEVTDSTLFSTGREEETVGMECEGNNLGEKAGFEPRTRTKFDSG